MHNSAVNHSLCMLLGACLTWPPWLRHGSGLAGAVQTLAACLARAGEREARCNEEVSLIQDEFRAAVSVSQRQLAAFNDRLQVREDRLTWLTLPYGKCSMQAYASGRPCFIICTYISDAAVAVQVLRAELAAGQAAGMPAVRLQRLQGWLQPLEHRRGQAQRLLDSFAAVQTSIFQSADAPAEDEDDIEDLQLAQLSLIDEDMAELQPDLAAMSNPDELQVASDGEVAE